MLRSVHVRLFILATLVLGATALIGWSARSVERRFGELHEGLQLAQRFEENIIALNTQLNQLTLSTDERILTALIADSRAFGAWLASEAPQAQTPRQRRMLEGIASSYAGYLTSINGLVENPPAEGEDRLRRLVPLEEQLNGLMRESVAGFLGEVREGLFLRQSLTFVLLAILLCFLVWLAAVVYRGMIAPLRVRLVEADSAVEQSQKLAALGELAAGIAHEIRNPLTAIKARLFTHRKTLGVGNAAYEHTEFISREIDRLERIVREFLLFARPGEPRFAAVSAHEILRSVRDLLAIELAGSAVDLQVEEGPDFDVRADAQHLQQVLINLARNAVESVGGRGRVVLRARRERVALRGLQQHVGLLEVQDNGKGIPAETQRRLFDPFFTTKPNGTGLGLSIAARIVEKHGGALRYQTQVNRGTTFGIVLPLERTRAGVDVAE